MARSPKKPSSDWLSEGVQHVWLPYSQMQNVPVPLPVIDANGCKLILEDGRELIDGTSSWWSACHGYKNPHIVKSIKDQAEQLSHVMFAGLGNEPAYELSRRLSHITGMERVFFSDSGSTSIEVAMKMAFQYWRNNNQQRTKFISFKNGYHGDTMGAMSLADPNDWVHKTFESYSPKQICLDLPQNEAELKNFGNVLEQNREDVIAVIIEPLMQGAGGFKFHPPEILRKIYMLTKQYDILFIADEVATGFCRLGRMFACEEASIKPDIMCLGKALTGGYIPLAATLATEEIFNMFLDNNIEKAFMHGPTYMGNPLACAAANASLDLFESEPRQNQVKKIEAQLSEQITRYKTLDCIKDVRVKGALLVAELKESSWRQTLKIREKFIAKNVWLRPFDNVSYIMPPFIISEDELTELCEANFSVLESL